MSEPTTPEGMKPPNKFDLDYQFFLYLKKMGIHPKDIPVGQYGSWKRAFYAGVGQMLMLVTMELSTMSPYETNKQTRYMADQITDFWKGDADRSRGEIVKN